jgi:hypothetical protein
MLEAWHDFFVLLGTAAAALAALLFVAASIGAGYMRYGGDSPTHTFISPVLLHYSYVLFASLVALVPIHSEGSFAGIIGISAALALGYAVHILLRVWRSAHSDMDDRLAYGAGPPIAYVLALVAAVGIFAHLAFGLPLLAGALIFLLLVNIRNTWDLTIFFSQRRRADDVIDPS